MNGLPNVKIVLDHIGRGSVTIDGATLPGVCGVQVDMPRIGLPVCVKISLYVDALEVEAEASTELLVSAGVNHASAIADEVLRRISAMTSVRRANG